MKRFEIPEFLHLHEVVEGTSFVPRICDLMWRIVQRILATCYGIYGDGFLGENEEVR